MIYVKASSLIIILKRSGILSKIGPLTKNDISQAKPSQPINFTGNEEILGNQYLEKRERLSKINENNYQAYVGLLLMKDMET